MVITVADPEGVSLNPLPPPPGPSPRIKKLSGGGNHRVPTAREGGEHEWGTPPLVKGVRGSPPRKF